MTKPAPPGHNNAPPVARRPSAGTPPAKPAAVSPARGQPMRRLSSLASPVARTLAVIDGRLVALGCRARRPAEQPALVLEMGLLIDLRRGLARFGEEGRGKAEDDERIDTVLAEGVLAAVELALATVGDLGSEPGRHAERCLGYVRHLAAELVALGHDASKEKGVLVALAGRLTTGGPASAPAILTALEPVYRGLRSRLEAASPRQAPSLFDAWLAATV